MRTRPFPSFRSLAAAALLALVPVALGQGSKADYERALGLAQRTENKVFRARVRPHWLPDNTRFWYDIETGPGAREWVLVDAAAGQRTTFPDRAALSRALGENGPGAEPALRPRTGSDAPRRSRNSSDETELVFENRTKEDAELFWIDTSGERKPYGRLRAGQERRQHTFAGHVWLLVDKLGATLAVFEATESPGRAVLDEETAAAKTTAPAAPKPPERSPGESPDGRWVAFVRDHNLFLRPKSGGEATPLSRDGTEGDAYSGDVSWSPDSAVVVARRVKRGQEHKVYMVEAAPRDQVQPKLHSHEYLKPGDTLPKPLLRVFRVADRREFDVDDASYANPFTESGDIDLRWAPDGKSFTFVYNQRGHQVYRILEIATAALPAGTATDPTTIRPRVVVEEASSTFVDWTGKTWSHWLDATGEMLWMSERDGWCHLWLLDTRTGKPKHQVTKGAWVVRSVEHVDDAKREVWFWAGGVRPGQDPYYLHLCRVNFDGTGLVVLTEADGTHKAEFSPDRRWFLDTWSRVDRPPTVELRRADTGAAVCALETAEWSALTASGWTVPERFAAKGRDGTTDIFGIIVRPSNFDAAKKYPVIEEIYAGPQGAFVPKEFGRLTRQHAIAELGFVVVQIDGMGTSQRSKAFHDACWKNLGDSGFPDRIAWMKAAAATRPWMDLGRVGVYGGSAGGQSSTRALLAHGDFYKAAVSDCGCHDNRMDKIWWNEQWMGWPVGPHYAEQSNVTQARNLTGHLLLIVGELDTNVDPASTLQVAAALVRADKDFDLLIVPGANHGAGESPYGSRRRMDHFVRHLLGREPRWE